MKKFLKYTVLLFFIIILCSGFIFRNKLSLIYNLGKKYIEVKDENPELSWEYDELENMDYKDIVYKERNGNPLTLDIYSSKKSSRKYSPVILYVHGGGWLYGDKSIPNSLSPILEAFRENGYTIISTAYELLNKDVSFDDQVSDVKDTLKWITKNADNYGFDINNIGVIGTSSGAHLSLLASYSNSDEFPGDTSLMSYKVKVDYIIDLFGPTDLSTLDIGVANWDMQQVLNTIENKEYYFNKYSPLNYVKENQPNILIVHSTLDELVPYDNALKLYEKNIEKGNDATLITLNFTTHSLTNISEEDIKSFILGLLKFILFKTPN